MSKGTQAGKAKIGNKAGELAKQVWLAGLGAYGKAFDEATERYDKATKESPKLFRELVAKGTKIENEAKEAIADSKIGKTSSSLEQRITKMRDSVNFSFPGQVSHDDLSRVEARLDKLAKEVAKLSKAVAASTKTAEKKPVKAKKASASA
jgi:polyhydroxyalkanoate synthesis regulator phasin